MVAARGRTMFPRGPLPRARWACWAFRRAVPSRPAPRRRALDATIGSRGRSRRDVSSTWPSSGSGTIGPVRRLIKIALVALGIRAFLRWRRGRSEAQTAAPSAAEPDPADELRRKLAESREDEAEAAAPPVAAVADRRADVHEQGRAALDEMKSSGES